MSKYVYNSNRGDYLTPPDFIKQLLKELDRDEFMCDVCCTLDNIPAFFRYKKDGLYLDGNKLGNDDGLKGDWFKLNWCNPPFAKADSFVKKAIFEQHKGNTTYMLIPVRTEMKYWYNGILNNGRPTRRDISIKFLKKGLCFYSPETNAPVQMQKKMKDGTTQSVDGVFKEGLALVVFKGKKSKVVKNG